MKTEIIIELLKHGADKNIDVEKKIGFMGNQHLYIVVRMEMKILLKYY